MDKDSDQPQRPVAEITIVNDDLPVFVTPSPKDEDFSSVPFSEFDLVQRDKNPQNSKLANNYCRFLTLFT